MNILIIGLGSMGKRRIRLLREMYPDYRIYGVDGRPDRREETYDLLKIECADTIENAALQFNIDTVFVCTSPLSHASIIKECLLNRWNIFTELNLVADGYQENMELAKKNACVLFLSSTFFYREEIKYIRGYVSPDKKWNYIYHIGQYLPDWHPWENYNEFFIGNKRTNGCREIMAIELPWIIETFGKVVATNVVSDKLTNLKIDYNDNYIIQLTHESGNKGAFIVDVVSPVAVRKFEAYSENAYIQWSGTPETLFEFRDNKLNKVVLSEKEEHIEGYRDFVVENAYKNEIKEFIDVVTNRKEPIYGFKQDLKVLGLIDILEGMK